MPGQPSSRIAGAARLTAAELRERIAAAVPLDADEQALLAAALAGAEDGPFPGATYTRMVENAIGAIGLPLGVALNFTIDGRDRFVPMAVEEPSVVAAASNAARIARPHGGFRTEVVQDLMIGQVHLVGCPDPHAAAARILAAKDDVLAAAEPEGSALRAAGGGAKDLEVRHLPPPGDVDDAHSAADAALGHVVVVHLLVDCKDAMGANAVNTRAENAAPLLESLSGGEARLRILSNLSDRRVVRATATFDRDLLGPEGTVGRILEAQAIAERDPFRAATHNKGVMNGIGAVVVATGNDWRAVEASAHAWCAREGRYSPLTTYEEDAKGHLVGTLELPLSLGTIGGATRVNPMARLALRVAQAEGAADLARLTCAAGLAQNLAALRALATEGIQRGHMRLHERAGART